MRKNQGTVRIVQPIAPKIEPLALISITETGKQPNDYHKILAEMMKPNTYNEQLQVNLPQQHEQEETEKQAFVHIDDAWPSKQPNPTRIVLDNPIRVIGKLTHATIQRPPRPEFFLALRSLLTNEEGFNLSDSYFDIVSFPKRLPLRKGQVALNLDAVFCVAEDIGEYAADFIDFDNNGVEAVWEDPVG